MLGRDITAHIANMRIVDWESLAINFVLVYSPHAFDGAPATHLATLTYPDGGTPAEEGAILRAVADNFPMITAVRVKEALQAVGAIVSNLVLAIRAASAITLLAAALVLGGALAAGHRARVYDAVILKTLGATRSRLIGIYATRIPVARRRYGLVRRARGLARRLAHCHRIDALALRLAAAAGDGCRARRGRGNGGLGAHWHVYGAWAETGPGSAQPLEFVTAVLPERSISGHLAVTKR